MRSVRPANCLRLQFIDRSFVVAMATQVRAVQRHLAEDDDKRLPFRKRKLRLGFNVVLSACHWNDTLGDFFDSF